MAVAVAVRNAGHRVVLPDTGDRLLVTTGRMDDVHVGTRTRTVSAGADTRWRQVAAETAAESRSTAYTGPLLDRLAALMAEAKASGQVRSDVNPLDLRVVLCGMCLQPVNLAERDPALWRRYGEPTLQALRA